MKVNINEKPYLPEGRHTVKVTEVEDGRSEHKDIPFFNCRLENEEGFINQRFYLSEPGEPFLAAFLEAVGVDGNEFDTKKLEGKVLSIEVEERTYEDPNGKEKTIKQGTNFKAAGEADFSGRF